MLLSQVRIVPVTTPAPIGPVDVRTLDHVVVAVAPRLTPLDGEQVVPGDGRWLIPGLWDSHVHLGQWSVSHARLDLSGTGSPDEVLTRVATSLPHPGLLVGAGYRSAAWARQPTVSELDAVTGGTPVVLVSGDCHNGWMNSAGLAMFGVPPRESTLEEALWFDVMPIVTAAERTVAGDACVGDAIAEALTRGIVGIVDLEFDGPFASWPRMLAAGIGAIHVRAGTYAHTLDDVIAAGLRTGDPLVPGADLVRMGPLKIIYDGSLNTRTACCFEPYAAGDLAHPRGRTNCTTAELTDLLARARRAGLTVAVHAIGDEAVCDVLDAVEATGARGGVEHAQLMRTSDIARMAGLGMIASVQPAHLIDDRPVAARLWADRLDRCFPVASLLRAGVDVRLGSDAPVSPLDPWLAMASAVHRGRLEDDEWNPAESLTAGQALACSVDGRGTVRPGSPADLVLLDADPLGTVVDDPLIVPDSTTAAARLLSMPVAATIVRGALAWSGASLRPGD